MASSGCTSTSEPNASAIAWATYPSPSDAGPISHTGRRMSRVISPIPSDVLVGHLGRLALLHHEPDREQQGRHERDSDGEAVFTPAYSPMAGAAPDRAPHRAPGGRRRTRNGGSASTSRPSAMPPT